MKKRFLPCACAAVILLLAMCPALPGWAASKPTAITIAPKTLSLLVGKTKTLKATVSPAAAPQDVKWVSSKPSVASVSQDGVVQAKKAGTCLIKAVSGAAPGVSKVVRVRVKRTKVNRMLAIAYKYRGRKYRTGDKCNPPASFDCSRFTSYVLGKAGISISGDIVSQAAYAKNHFTEIDALSDLKRGDLVYFDTQSDKKVGHAAFYLGNKKIIHASSSAGKVAVSDFDDYYIKRFLFGARIWS